MFKSSTVGHLAHAVKPIQVDISDELDENQSLELDDPGAGLSEDLHFSCAHIWPRTGGVVDLSLNWQLNLNSSVESTAIFPLLNV